MIVFPVQIYLNCILYPKSKHNISILYFPAASTALPHDIQTVATGHSCFEKKRLDQAFPVSFLGKNIIIISPLFPRKSEVKWPVVRMHHHLTQIKLVHHHTHNYKKCLIPGFLSVSHPQIENLTPQMHALIMKLCSSYLWLTLGIFGTSVIYTFKYPQHIKKIRDEKIQTFNIHILTPYKLYL